jgi:hypothetical protein
MMFTWSNGIWLASLNTDILKKISAKTMYILFYVSDHDSVTLESNLLLCTQTAAGH